MKKENKIQILRKLIQLPTINNNETTVVDFIISLFKPYPTVQIKKSPTLLIEIILLLQSDTKTLDRSSAFLAIWTSSLQVL
jgi:hypothetical protein